MKITEQFDQRLQGEPNGRRAFAVACEKLGGTKAGELVPLDFSDVLVVTASWLSAMLLPLYRWAADEETDWLDDLRLVARHNRKLFLIRPATAETQAASLVGPMDDAERRTLMKIAELGEATGAMLERKCPEENIRATGWNNRLKDLYEKRVLRRVKRGREHVYSLVAKGMMIDG